MFSTHNPGFSHSDGLERTMALIEMTVGAIFVPTVVFGVLFLVCRSILGF